MTHRAPPSTAPPRDWRTMTRGDFDDTAPPPPLFDLEPAAVCAVDPCGTADMFELLGDNAS